MRRTVLTLSAVAVAVAVAGAPAAFGQSPTPAQPPAVKPATPATAVEELLEEGRWRLPKSHRYEAYTAQGAYVHVDLTSVPLRLDRGEMIFDRTAKVWVLHPSSGPNARYLRPAGALSGPDVLSDGRWRLPRSHHYELYHTDNGSYSRVDVGKVAALADKGQPIYDRTDKIWVLQAGEAPNPRYLASSAPATPTPPPVTAAPPAATAPTVVAPDVLSDGRWRLPRSHQYELYNTETATYGKIDVTRVAALADKGQPVYDRTDNVWVFQLGHGPNARYLVAAAPVPAAAGGAGSPSARAPRHKDDCKNDGWKVFSNPAFSNQGDCVSWVNAHR